MNRPPDTFIPMQEERLLAFATTCFEAVGLTPEHATLLSRLLVNSDLRGVRSHGTRLVNEYCRQFQAGQLNPQPNIHLIHETPTAIVLNGDGTVGYWPMVQATELAIAKAKTVGMGMGLVRDIGHYGSAGHYARLCMDAGCIGFSVQGYREQGNMRGRDPKPQLGYFGNPPICFAIPGQDKLDVVLDAATCILGDDQRGPEYDALLALIPAAFFKSIGYGAVATLLGGDLTGFHQSDDVLTRWPGARMGGMVLAIHIGSVMPEALFRAGTDRLAHDIRETYEPLPGTDRALLPGAIEEERMALHRRAGIRYGEWEQGLLRSISEHLGVPLPWDESV